MSNLLFEVIWAGSVTAAELAGDAGVDGAAALGWAMTQPAARNKVASGELRIVVIVAQCGRPHPTNKARRHSAAWPQPKTHHLDADFSDRPAGREITSARRPFPPEFFLNSLFWFPFLRPRWRQLCL